MTDSLSMALTLMIVGMLSVFGILTLVYLGGKAIIIVGNRFDFESTNTKPSKIQSDDSSLDIAIVSSVIQKISEGKAKNITIKKLS